MEILQTPDGAADGLDDYPSERHYVTVPAGDGQTMRIHYVDEGEPDAPLVLFLHGNPSWSYLWRHQIEAVVVAGFRAIAVDLGGMGLSDKPSELGDYSVAAHVRWMRSALFDELDVRDAVFVLHDWGGIIGLRLVADSPDRIRGVVISNTGLPTRDPAESMPEEIEASGPFADFQAFVRDVPEWEPWTMLGMVMETEPSPAVVEGYRAPYPDPSLTIASRAFTQLLPTRPDNPMLPDNFEAWKVLDTFDKPVLTIFSDKDVVAPTGYVPIQARIPGAAGQPHVILEGGGHFLQEDIPGAYNAALLDWLRDL